MHVPYCMYMVFPLCDDFIIDNGHFRLKYRLNDRKPLKFIENRCADCALQLFFIGKKKCAHPKGNIKHVIILVEAITSNFSCFFTPKIAKIAKDKCSHCAIGIDYSFRCLLTAPLHRIIALRVHPLTCLKESKSIFLLHHPTIRANMFILRVFCCFTSLATQWGVRDGAYW